ncbi:response regulator, partial [Acinetobacter baumannii]
TKHNYSLALLDINLPGKSGMELCKILRNEDANISLIMLTALGEIQDKVDAFKLGADDYIVKPFHFDELMARIKAALQRTSLSDDNIL